MVGCRLQGTCLSWLQDTSYSHIDHELICAFVERWNELILTLDDVSCLLHLIIDGLLLSHSSITRDEAVDMMVEHLGSNLGDALFEAR